MITRRFDAGWPLLAAACALSLMNAGCSLEEGRAGAECKRSTQCQAGLGCVRGKCSKDLGPIAETSTVPDLGQGDGGMAPAAGSGGGMAAGAPAAGGGGGTGGGGGS